MAICCRLWPTPSRPTRRPLNTPATFVYCHYPMRSALETLPNEILDLIVEQFLSPERRRVLFAPNVNRRGIPTVQVRPLLNLRLASSCLANNARLNSHVFQVVYFIASSDGAARLKRMADLSRLAPAVRCVIFVATGHSTDVKRIHFSRYVRDVVALHARRMSEFGPDAVDQVGWRNFSSAAKWNDAALRDGTLAALWADTLRKLPCVVAVRPGHLRGYLTPMLDSPQVEHWPWPPDTGQALVDEYDQEGAANVSYSRLAVGNLPLYPTVKQQCLVVGAMLQTLSLARRKLESVGLHWACVDWSILERNDFREEESWTGAVRSVEFLKHWQEVDWTGLRYAELESAEDRLTSRAVLAQAAPTLEELFLWDGPSSGAGFRSARDGQSTCGLFPPHPNWVSRVEAFKYADGRGPALPPPAHWSPVTWPLQTLTAPSMQTMPHLRALKLADVVLDLPRFAAWLLTGLPSLEMLVLNNPLLPAEPGTRRRPAEQWVLVFHALRNHRKAVMVEFQYMKFFETGPSAWAGPFQTPGARPELQHQHYEDHLALKYLADHVDPGYDVVFDGEEDAYHFRHGHLDICMRRAAKELYRTGHCVWIQAIGPCFRTGKDPLVKRFRERMSVQPAEAEPGEKGDEDEDMMDWGSVGGGGRYTGAFERWR